MYDRCRMIAFEGDEGLTKKRKRSKKRTGLYLVIALVLLLVVTLGAHGMTLSQDCDKLSAEVTELEAKKKELEQESEEIKERSEYMKTDAYIEDVAREKFGLAYDDEIIFKAADSN